MQIFIQKPTSVKKECISAYKGGKHNIRVHNDPKYCMLKYYTPKCRQIQAKMYIFANFVNFVYFYVNEIMLTIFA